MGPRIIDEQILAIEDESNIRHAFRRLTAASSPTAAPKDVLIVEFAGTYGVGSAGRRDAAVLIATSKAALTLWPCDALIFDLRKLEYVWGDDIYELFELNRLVGFTVPAAVISSRLSLSPLEGIIASTIGEPSVRVFLSRKRALAHVLDA